MSFFASSVINPMLFFTLLHICIPLYFYFNDVYARDNRSVWAIYIPLCFYFNDNWHRRWLVRLYIYIPLCFYFNCPPLFPVGSVTFIYIPLCFYFNLLPKERPLPDPLIYIPLCFYFNEDQTCSSLKGKEFTSHYASTLMYGSGSGRQAITWFTFHYASTLIHEIHGCKIEAFHLHSTMLLL